MKTVRATFKGKNDSLGYKNDQDYDLIINHSLGERIKIEQRDGGGRCEYDSIISFLNNWKLHQETNQTTRVEVVDDKGRTYVNWKNDNKVELSFQDNGKTLKVFISK